MFYYHAEFVGEAGMLAAYYRDKDEEVTSILIAALTNPPVGFIDLYTLNYRQQED